MVTNTTVTASSSQAEAYVSYAKTGLIILASQHVPNGDDVRVLRPQQLLLERQSPLQQRPTHVVATLHNRYAAFQSASQRLEHELRLDMFATYRR